MGSRGPTPEHCSAPQRNERPSREGTRGPSVLPAEGRKPTGNGYGRYESDHTMLGKHPTMRRVTKIGGCQGLWGGESRAQGIFRAVKLKF